ncbi:MAG: glycosyltransferase 87 family protein, partial [Candidatus Dormibacteria bacterium]
RLILCTGLLALVAVESWAALTNITHSDFIVFWEAARRLSAHADPYDSVAVSAAAWKQLAVAHPPYPLPYAYLPELAWLLRPLAQLPFRAANAVWLGISLVSIGAGLGLLIATARRLAPRTGGATLLVCASTITLASASGIAEGQVDGPLLLLAALALALLPRRRLAAGVALGLAAALKPQILWFVPLALLVVREWRTLAGMLIGGLGCLALSLAVVPPSQLGEWMRQLFQGLPAPSSTVSLPGIVIDWAGPTAALVAAAGLALVALIALWWMRARLDARTALGLGIVLSLLIAPHDYSHDLLLLGVLAATAALITGWSRTLVLAVIALDVATWVDAWLPGSWAHVEALVMLALVVALIWQARPRAERPREPSLDPATTG